MAFAVHPGATLAVRRVVCPVAGRALLAVHEVWTGDRLDPATRRAGCTRTVASAGNRTLTKLGCPDCVGSFDEFTGLAKEAVRLHMFPPGVCVAGDLCAGLRQILAGLVGVPEAVMSHRDEGYIGGLNFTVAHCHRFFNPANRGLEPTGSVQSCAKRVQGDLPKPKIRATCSDLAQPQYVLGMFCSYAC